MKTVACLLTAFSLSLCSARQSHAQFSNAVFTPYAGLGLGVTHVSFDPDAPLNLLEDEETDYGLNVIGGAAFGAGPVRPFAQARITLGDHMAFLNEDDEGGAGYALMGGLLFRLGQ